MTTHHTPPSTKHALASCAESAHTCMHARHAHYNARSAAARHHDHDGGMKLQNCNAPKGRRITALLEVEVLNRQPGGSSSLSFVSASCIIGQPDDVMKIPTWANRLRRPACHYCHPSHPRTAGCAEQPPTIHSGPYTNNVHLPAATRQRDSLNALPLRPNAYSSCQTAPCYNRTLLLYTVVQIHPQGAHNNRATSQKNATLFRTRDVPGEQ